MTIADVNALSRVLPEITATLRATDDACAVWSDRLEAVGAAVCTLQSGLAAEAAGATWSTVDPFEIALATPPTVVLRADAPAGGTVDVHVSAHGAGVRVTVGGDAFDAPDAAALAGLLLQIARAAHRESRVLTVTRLTGEARYRVQRAFRGAQPGDVLVFREVAEVKPSGAECGSFAPPMGGASR